MTKMSRMVRTTLTSALLDLDGESLTVRQLDVDARELVLAGQDRRLSCADAIFDLLGQLGGRYVGVECLGHGLTVHPIAPGRNSVSEFPNSAAGNLSADHRGSVSPYAS